jgi:hypothetical protein
MDLTVEEVLYVQSELQAIAVEQGHEGQYTYDTLLAYNTAERWTDEEWINGDTAEYCFYYVAEEAPTEPMEETPVEPDTQPEETTNTEEVEGV